MGDLGLHIAFAETQWGLWPDCPYYKLNSNRKFHGKLGNVRRLGAFDIWITQELTRATNESADDFLASMNLLNDTQSNDEKIGSTIIWPDPFTRSDNDKRGKDLDH